MVDCQAAINRSKKVKGDAEEMKHAKAMRAQAHELRGSIYQNLHVTKSSLAEFEKALSLDPYLVSALLRRAVTHAIAEDFADALNDCNTAISIDSARADAYCGRGMIFSVRSEFAKAIEDFTQAVQLNRKCAKAYSGRALVYSAMAGLEFEKAKKSRDPAESESCRQKAKELRQKCIEDATEAIHANRHMARAYLTRALANGNQGNLPNAINDLNAAIREDPKMIKAYYHRGMILARVGQVKAAISDFEEAIKLQPDNWRLDLLIAECYKQLGDAILMNQHLKAATEKKQRAQKDMADSLDDPAGMIAAPLKRQPELRPDVDLDPLETARKELEKKLDATRDR